jgi:hypothetical protein
MLQLYPIQIPGLVFWFNEFVGPANLENRIDRVERKLANIVALSPAVQRRFEFHRTYQKILIESRSNLQADLGDLAVNRALSFISAVKEICMHSTPSEQNRWRSRILDGLKPDRDLRQLRHEIRAYVHYAQAGCRLTWGDDHKDRFDLLVVGPRGTFEVECKTFAEDIGSPFSIDESFLVLGAVRTGLERGEFPPSGIITIELKQRGGVTPHELIDATKDFVTVLPPCKVYDNVTFRYERRIGWDTLLAGGHRDAIKNEFGSWQADHNHHSMIAIVGKRAVFVQMATDRRSKLYSAITDSLKKASEQFSTQRPAVIWGHFLGLTESQFKNLLERQRLGARTFDVFGHYVFKSEARKHVCRLRFSADGAEIRVSRTETPRGLVRDSSDSGPAYDLSSLVSRFDPELTNERSPVAAS